MSVVSIGTCSSTGMPYRNGKSASIRAQRNPFGHQRWRGACLRSIVYSSNGSARTIPGSTSGAVKIWSSPSRRGCVAARSRLCPVRTLDTSSGNARRT
ncbi:AGAP012256-PA, partial [Anopheles gambiae str. PEST]